MSLIGFVIGLITLVAVIVSIVLLFQAMGNISEAKQSLEHAQETLNTMMLVWLVR